MSSEDKILKILESMDIRLDSMDNRLSSIENRLEQQRTAIADIQQHQNRTDIALDSLKAGVDDVRANMTNMEERLRSEIVAARTEAKADHLRILGKLDKQNTRIENLEKATGTPNPHKN